jgi:hypothetical protein
MVQLEPNISNDNDKGADISASLHYHFDVVYLLTTNRTERAVNECKRIGILPVVCVSEIHTDKIISFNMSMISILRKFIQSGLGRCLILEDDVIFQNEDTTFCSGWDMVYLGGNYLPAGDNTAPEYVDENTRRIYNAWTTHAVGYTQKAAQWIVANYDLSGIYDDWLNQNIYRFKVYATVPMVAIQEPGESSLWERAVDYTDIFTRSNDYLTQISHNK